VSPFEDIAEVTNLWINHHAALLQLAERDPAIQQRVDFMRSVFGDRYVFEDIDTQQALDSTKRICDSTT